MTYINPTKSYKTNELREILLSHDVRYFTDGEINETELSEAIAALTAREERLKEEAKIKGRLSAFEDVNHFELGNWNVTEKRNYITGCIKYEKAKLTSHGKDVKT